MRSTTVSRVMPMPPRICSERSATRAIASEQITLLIELSLLARWPWSSTQAVCQIDSRARWMAEVRSAGTRPDPKDDPRLENLMKQDMQRSMMSLPHDVLIAQLRKMSPQRGE